MFPTKIIFFVPIIITLLLLFNDFCDASLDNTNYIEGNQTQSSDNVTSYNLTFDHSNAEIYSFYTFGILLYILGVISTLYVMLRTYVRWKRNDLALNMTHKLPFYMASSDFFIYVVQIINLAYPAVHFETWPDLSCKFVGASFFYFSISNMLLVGSLALLSHFKVCKKKYYHLGVLDYKLFIFPILLPIVLTSPGWNYFGSSDYWCYSNNNSKYVHITLLTVDMTILLISLYCYIGITYTINIAKLKVADEQFLAASRKIVGYLFMYILQWTPVMIYILIDFKQKVQIWVFFVFFISLPLGGILNGYRYVSNEGWWVRPKGTTSTTSTSTHSSPDDESTSPSFALPNSTGKQIVDDRRQNPYLVMVSKENGDYDGGNSVELKKIGIKHDNNDDIMEIGKAV